MAIISDNLNNAAQLYVAECLIKLGARPSIVSTLCGIRIRKVREIYSDVRGRQSPSGALPSDTHWILRCSTNCIHASIFFGIYRRILLEIGVSDKLNYAHAFVTAYSIYNMDCAANDEASKLDINRAYDIVRQDANGDIAMRLCATCGSNHLALSFYPDQLNGCPVCHVWTNADGRFSWMSTRAMNHRKNGRQRFGTAKNRVEANPL
ncbi:MAG: FlhC family transcriptional regulator [Candidatus Methylumidiphilus sp.]